jgi:hypothetical protein
MALPLVAVLLQRSIADELSRQIELLNTVTAWEAP